MGFLKKAFSAVTAPVAAVANVIASPAQKVAAPVVKAASPILKTGIGALSLPTSLAAKTTNALGIGGYIGEAINKAAASSEKLTDKAGALSNYWMRDYADALKQGQGLNPSRLNRTFQEGRRAHIRTNTPQMLQQGLASGAFRMNPDGTITDRFGQSVQGKGLGQRGTDIINYAAIAMPALAPIAAGANLAQGVSQGRPVGKSLMQAGLQYGAGAVGGRLGGMAGPAGSTAARYGSAVGRGVASGGANAGVAAYNQGLRGSDLWGRVGEGALQGGALGGLGAWANPQIAALGLGERATKAAQGALRGTASAALRGDNLLQGGAFGGIGGAYGGGAAGAARAFYNSRNAPQRAPVRTAPTPAAPIRRAPPQLVRTPQGALTPWGGGAKPPGWDAYVAAGGVNSPVYAF